MGNIENSSILKIDRSKHFNPKNFFGEGWYIDEQDERAITLSEIDLTEVIVDSTLEMGNNIKGEEILNYLKEKTNYIRLDAGIFNMLRHNQIIIPEKWKDKLNGNAWDIVFYGTVFMSPEGNRYVLSFCWDGEIWDCCYEKIADRHNYSGQAAVLKLR